MQKIIYLIHNILKTIENYEEIKNPWFSLKTKKPQQ